MSSDALETGLPDGWEVRRSNTKNLPYYFHAATKDSRWEPPAGTDSEKLKVYMSQVHSSKVQPSQSNGGGDRIRCAHLLVKHKDSRRPASWREAKITRDYGQAEQEIKQYQQQIQAYQKGEGGKSLSDLATTESDCSSARKGGDLGFFGRGDMQKEFEDAAFRLQPGEVSDIVSTASGLHLIQRQDHRASSTSAFSLTIYPTGSSRIRILPKHWKLWWQSVCKSV
ncbi:rotamase-domain-containing protein [Corynespora cassiicola Philippines]|uniref:Peptidyl-prolyl cis-trans isomerase n=1 Tax=Corynespora cassiicola Philippines TaxID=1448308 RepID=A0A2T2P8V8_CORCC|nr:rotamase-domain-containing protein [Corynespora cassiicola Philippines]